MSLSPSECAAEKKWPGWFIAAIIVLSFIKLWLIKGQPLNAIGYAAHDDRLFVSLAINILQGEWLGAYNSMTLAKGCFYPIWLAFVFISNIPLLFFQHLLYIFAVTVLINAIKPFFANKPAFLLILFGVLLFNPATYAQMSLRVIREGIYPSLSLLVVATSIGVLARYRSKNTCFVAWLFYLGLSLSAFWLTREEGIWILPFVFLMLGWTAVKLLRLNFSGRFFRFGLCLTPFVVLSLALLTVSTVNRICYGAFTTVEFKNRHFLDAYGALNRVKPEQAISRVPVTKETRTRIYPFSPAFQELKPYLEGNLGEKWATISSRVYPELKGKEIAGGWFMWALREAVDDAGYCSSAGKAMAFYSRLADEINAACDRGDLASFPKRSSMMPVWQSEFNRPLLHAIENVAKFLITFRAINPEPPNSKGTESQMVLFRDFTHERLSLPNTNATQKIQLSGWAFGAKERLMFSIRKTDGSLAYTTMRWSSSPDVYNHFLDRQKKLPNSQKSRFEMSVIRDDDIYLEARTKDNRVVKKIPLDGRIKYIEGPDMYFCLDDISATPIWSIMPGKAMLDEFRVEALRKIGREYQRTMPFLTVLSLVVFLFGIIFNWIKEKKVSDISIISIGLLAILLSRITILSIIHITAFPAINTTYLSPVYPVLIIFVFMAVTVGMVGINARKKHIYS